MSDIRTLIGKWQKSAKAHRRQATRETRSDRIREEAWATCYEQCARDLADALQQEVEGGY